MSFRAEERLNIFLENHGTQFHDNTSDTRIGPTFQPLLDVKLSCDQCMTNIIMINYQLWSTFDQYMISVSLLNFWSALINARSTSCPTAARNRTWPFWHKISCSKLAQSFSILVHSTVWWRWLMRWLMWHLHPLQIALVAVHRVTCKSIVAKSFLFCGWLIDFVKCRAISGRLVEQHPSSVVLVIGDESM